MMGDVVSAMQQPDDNAWGNRIPGRADLTHPFGANPPLLPPASYLLLPSPSYSYLPLPLSSAIFVLIYFLVLVSFQFYQTC